MDSYKTEEEQIIALKRWWKDNGNSLLIGIGLALAVVFGWKAYQQNVENNKNAASVLYQQLLEVAVGSPASEESESSIEFIATKLKSEFNSSEYAAYAALFLAKSAVGKGDLSAAATELRWILDNFETSPLTYIVKGRLARVLDAQGSKDEALALLDVAGVGSHAAMYLEIKGDILNRAGEVDAAKAAYLEAYKAMKESGVQRPLLTLKMAELGLSEEDA